MPSFAALSALLLSGGAVRALEPVHGGSLRVAAVSRSVAPAAVATDAPPTAKDGYRTRAQLKKGIASFYDGSSALWERVWGEHMHHGYYPVGSKRNDHQKAQEDMIDEVLKWARQPGEPAPVRVLDVGCGIGGSTRHLAREFGCEGRGITLSPYQARRANEISAQAGMADRLSFQVADALDMPFEDESFDLVWSLESGEHMPDKAQFVSELCRVLRPGGRLILVAWTHRDLTEGEVELKPKEEKLLQRISQAYYLPRWCSVNDYISLITAKGLGGIKRDDWTQNVARFWPAVIASSFRPSSILGLFKSGWSTLRGALVMPLMIRGQKKGTIRFGLVTATKAPAAAGQESPWPSIDQMSTMSQQPVVKS